ncbi:TPA: antiterminator Q family protein [Klebsiella aerogenes]|uniref:antiterminator Q family protein n=1 Tax=Klebsiella aerogenes TaxID=548 RepID=UPI000B40BCBE|nr:antiterminator Q family protein [Klebsiella aerogenes]EKU0354065.1 antitermination protein Q [Klebsiella aerogenes]EKZ6360735.1 antitermination protein Q [Klebsiella aerogenes]MBK0634540.1 antitermination protein Q [Klebsiella aerogenes]RNT11880.1 antitermination protein Q [Klebsiella aerogenes]HBS5779194.1 antitermination protein Q [Klebsiella aerogenes]
MRNIQQVLERWGGWAAQDNTAVSWAPIAAGFKGLVAAGTTTRLSCCDDDGLVIDACVCRLQQVRKPEELDVIMLYYVHGLTKREIGRRRRCSEGFIRQQLQVAEGFIEGCLCMLGVGLQMDPEVEIQRDEKSISALRKNCATLV